ncbi:GDSL-like Lipase/Acylhydrolase [Tothia fuscella]|uniref:GDSL-like Lipase/Acylhydrolase n=1 Tax=Tothia fuscella TaxID=1048955 RepID=A0A9P4NJ23_9PEZI|nr:GDSL-like Lipase/Acylhydrolase [Tothia fuscella]
MFFSSPSFLILALLAPVLSSFVYAIPLADPDSESDGESSNGKPIAFVLTGDSTTAKAGGWGDGFITFIEKPNIGTNHGKGGATTVSFKSGGNWGKAMDDVKKHVGQFQVYVTIQFGHNDQKQPAGISISQFQKNLAAMAAEVKSAGAIPILVTSLTRRTFQGNKVVENLSNERTAAMAAAKSGGYKFIDLNVESTRYVNAIGQSNANKYNLAEKDFTHLNDHGGVVFGRMVADLISQAIPEAGKAFKKNEAISSAIKAGKPAK